MRIDFHSRCLFFRYPFAQFVSFGKGSLVFIVIYDGVEFILLRGRNGALGMEIHRLNERGGILYDILGGALVLACVGFVDTDVNNHSRIVGGWNRKLAFSVESDSFPGSRIGVDYVDSITVYSHFDG